MYSVNKLQTKHQLSWLMWSELKFWTLGHFSNHKWSHYNLNHMIYWIVPWPFYIIFFFNYQLIQWRLIEPKHHILLTTENHELNQLKSTIYYKYQKAKKRILQFYTGEGFELTQLHFYLPIIRRRDTLFEQNW